MTYQPVGTNAHVKSVRMGIQDVAAFLAGAFGQKLVAYMAGVDDAKTVSRWTAGTHAPRDENELRLRVAYQVFHLLQEQESPHTIRAWFVGINPQLNDESPASAIREDRHKDVVVAARAFLSVG